MISKYFVAFEFDFSHQFSKKIVNFRHRYGQSAIPKQEAWWTFLPPFEMNHMKELELATGLEEEVQTFFFGQDAFSLQTSGIGVDFVKKKNILYLGVQEGPDLSYLKELCVHIISDHVPKSCEFHKRKNQLAYIPLAKFYREEDLQDAISQARLEFQNTQIIRLKSLQLFKKGVGRFKSLPPRTLATLIEFNRPLGQTGTVKNLVY